MTDHADDLLGRLNRALLDPVFGDSDWLQNFQAFITIEVVPYIEELEADRDHLAAWIASYHSADLLMRVREFWTPEDGAS